MRERAGLRRKPDDDPDPYFRDEVMENKSLHEGDLNPIYPQPPWATRLPGSDPATEAAAATGVPVEDIRRVLRYIFLEQQ